LNTRSKIAAILFVSIFVLAVFPTWTTPRTATAAPVTTQSFPSTGPLPDSLIFKMYTDPIAEYYALKTGEIDVMDWPIDKTQIPDALAQQTAGHLNLSQQADLGFFFFAMNCAHNPINYTSFRTAIAQLVDKSTIVSTGLGGYGFQLNTVVPKAVYGAFGFTNVTTWAYNAALANATLIAGGFSHATGSWVTPRGTPMPTLQFYYRNDDPPRNLAGQLLDAQLTALGIPHVTHPGDATLINAHVYTGYDYDIGTAGWTLGADPTYLYDFFNSGSPPTYNFVFYSNSTYDYWSGKMIKDPTYAEVLHDSYMCQAILAQAEPYIPLYERELITGARTSWTDWVDMVGTGYMNFFSLMQAHPRGSAYGGTMSVGLEQAVQSLNIVTAQWVWDWDVIGMIYDTLAARDPTTLAWEPWMAQNYTLTTCALPSVNPAYQTGLRIDWWLRSNLTWHDGYPVTSADVNFTYMWLQGINAPRYHLAFNIVNVTTPNPLEAIVYLNTTSYFGFGLAMWNIMPKHIWDKYTTFAQVQSLQPETIPGMMVGSGPFEFVSYRAGEYVQLAANNAYFRESPAKKPAGATVTQGSPYTWDLGQILQNSSLPATSGNLIDNATIPCTVTGSGVIETLGATFNGSSHHYGVQLDTTNLATHTYTLSATATWNLVSPPHGGYVQAFSFLRPRWNPYNNATQKSIPLNDLRISMILYDNPTQDQLWSTNPATNDEGAMYAHTDFGDYLNATQFFGSTSGGTAYMKLYEAGEIPPYNGYDQVTGRMTEAQVTLSSGIFTVSIWTGNLTNGATYGVVFFLEPVNASNGAYLAPTELWIGGGYNTGGASGGFAVTWTSTTTTYSRGYSTTVTVAPVVSVPWYSTGVGLFAIGATVVAVLVAAGLGYTLLRGRRQMKE